MRGSPRPIILVNRGFGIQIQADVRETEQETGNRLPSFPQPVRDRRGHREDPRTRSSRSTRRARGEFHEFYARVFEGILPGGDARLHGFLVRSLGRHRFLDGRRQRPARALSTGRSSCIGSSPGSTDAYLRAAPVRGPGLLSRNDDERPHRLRRLWLHEGPWARRRWRCCARAPRDAEKPINSGDRRPPRSSGRSPRKCTASSGSSTRGGGCERFGLATTAAASPCTTRSGSSRPCRICERFRSAPGRTSSAAAELMRGRYVMSLKPSPAVLVGSTFNGRSGPTGADDKAGGSPGVQRGDHPEGHQHRLPRACPTVGVGPDRQGDDPGVIMTMTVPWIPAGATRW